MEQPPMLVLPVMNQTLRATHVQIAQITDAPPDGTAINLSNQRCGQELIASQVIPMT
jgi:hypothetical protein